MKQHEIQKCAGCTRGVAHGGDVHFYRVKVEQFILDGRAIQRQAGLEAVVGNAALAAVLGPGEDIAHGLGEYSVLLCAHCIGVPVAAVLEGMSND